MRSPQGWTEPGQTPDFDEFTIVLRGLLKVKSQAGELDVNAGQAVITHAGEWVQYSPLSRRRRVYRRVACLRSPWTRFTAMSKEKAVRFARWVFLLAGVVGLVEIVPLYFLQATLSRSQPPPITHPEFYYGFVGVVLAWQIAFLIISRDPLRYVSLMPALFLEKLLYPAAVFPLYTQGRVHSQMLGGAALDVVWLVLFVAAWLRLRST